MLDLRYDSIVYQSQVYVSALVDYLITNKRLGKALDPKWAKVDLILAYLEALENKDNLQDEDDITDITFILECLIVLCEIASFPTAPTLLWSGTPSILVGIPGATGGTGQTGAPGSTGLATDFQVSNVVVTSIVDSFPIGNAKAARWDYYVSNGTAQRASSILGHWLPDGSLDELTDDGAEDIGGDTGGIEFDIVYSGGNINLIATITSGTWTIVGSRYFIPNNGNGTGPISAVLPAGQVYIGSVANVATPQTVSGAITLSLSGVATLGTGIITNTHISASAAIDTTKLLALPVSRIVVTNASGHLTTSVAPTVAELLHVGGATSNLQVQINSKMSDPMTSIGDMVIRNASNLTARLAPGSPGEVLTMVGAVPAWQTAPGGISGLTTSYIPKASSATTLTNSIMWENTGAIVIAGSLEAQTGIRTDTTGPYIRTKIVEIGDWDMDTVTTKAIPTASLGLADWTKVRAITAMIRNDGGTNLYTLETSTNNTDSGNGGMLGLDASNLYLRRALTRLFDSTDYNATGYNRGWITITYEA